MYKGDPAAVGMGDDGGVCAEREHGGVRRHGQHAHPLRPQQQGQPGHRQDGPRGCWI